MEQRGWGIALLASVVLGNVGCATHPTETPPRPLRLAQANGSEVGPPTPAQEPDRKAARASWLRRNLPELYTMPWYSKFGGGALVAGIIALVLTRHHHKLGDSGGGSGCKLPDTWDGRTQSCTDYP